MSVVDSLLAISQREDGGRTAYDRFDYQTAWGLSQLLTMHDAGKNYAIAFEFHDDIVSLDDADAPTNAIFYQIKTKTSGSWSFAQITSRPNSGGKKKSSFAGKMYDNFVRFGATVEKLSFVSNQPLPEVVIVHGEESFSKAEKAKLAKFVTEIASESAGFKDPDHTSLFFFHFSELNLNSYEDTVVGRIANFLEKQLGFSIPPKPFALTLNDHCRRRSKSLADITSFDSLKASKFVTRADMTRWLTQARDQHERRPTWHSISVELNIPFSEKIKIERAWHDYEFMIRSRSNAATIVFTEQIRKIIDREIDDCDSAASLLSTVFAEAKPVVFTWNIDASDYFVKAAILYELKR